MGSCPRKVQTVICNYVSNSIMRLNPCDPSSNGLLVWHNATTYSLDDSWSSRWGWSDQAGILFRSGRTLTLNCGARGYVQKQLKTKSKNQDLCHSEKKNVLLNLIKICDCINFFCPAKNFESKSWESKHKKIATGWLGSNNSTTLQEIFLLDLLCKPTLFLKIRIIFSKIFKLRISKTKRKY